MPLKPSFSVCLLAFAIGGLLLGAVTPAHGRYALEDFDLSGEGWAWVLGILFTGFCLAVVGFPCLLGWLTYKWLHLQHPAYSARARPSLVLACVVSWVGPWPLHYLLWELFGYGYALALPVAGAALGYYAYCRPLPLEEEPLA